MVDHALNRIREYVEMSGIEFVVGMFNSEDSHHWLEEIHYSPEILKL